MGSGAEGFKVWMVCAKVCPNGSVGFLEWTLMSVGINECFKENAVKRKLTILPSMF